MDQLSIDNCRLNHYNVSMPRRYRVQSTTPDSRLPLSMRPHVARLYRNIFLSDTAYEGLVSRAAEHYFVLPDPIRAKGLHTFIEQLFATNPAGDPTNPITMDWTDTRPEEYMLPIDHIPHAERAEYRALQRNPYASNLYPLWSPPMTLADPEPDRQRLRSIKMTDTTYDAILVVAFNHEIANANKRDYTFRMIANAARTGNADAAIPQSVLSSVISATLEAIGRGWLTPSYWPDNPHAPRARRFKNWKPEDSLNFYA